MASSHGNMQSEPVKMEQKMITEFFAKTRQIILESRCPHVPSRNYSGEQMISSPSSSAPPSPSIRTRGKWFNLDLRDCPAALENIDFLRQICLEPMVVDIILLQGRSALNLMSSSPRRSIVRNLSAKEQFSDIWNSGLDEFGSEVKTGKIVERWVVQYECGKNGRDCASGSKRSTGNSMPTSYKKLILLLRLLYSMIRLLPAYKLFRDLNSTGQMLTFNLTHRVSSFVEPFTHQEESEMQKFVFMPVETFCGRLCLSVSYCSSLSDVNSQPSTLITPQFIQDYVGSPMACPLKRFPSIPQGSPSFSPLERCHSWSHDICRAASPSPTYSDSHASISKPSSHFIPPTNLPRHLPETPQLHENNTNIDEYWPSVFSPSPSQSPPAYVPSRHVSKVLLRSESDPVSMASSKLGSAPPPLKGTRPVASKTEKSSDLTQKRSTVDKLLSFGKNERGSCSRVKLSSNSSPQISISRSSSRLSFQDDFDDSEFSGPFIVDDVDMADRDSRPASFDHKGHPCEPLEPGGLFQVRKTQDAAVTALVHMLKRAPPLRHDFSRSINSVVSFTPLTSTEQNVKSDPPRVQHATAAAVISVASSGHVVPKTTADALDELRGYRDMKDKLLGQGMRSQIQTK